MPSTIRNSHDVNKMAILQSLIEELRIAVNQSDLSILDQLDTRCRQYVEKLTDQKDTDIETRQALYTIYQLYMEIMQHLVQKREEVGLSLKRMNKSAQQLASYQRCQVPYRY